MKSKTTLIIQVIEGSHALGTNSLHDYHAAKAVVNAGRRVYPLPAIKKALKNHNVVVSTDSQGMIRIYNPVTKAEWLTGPHNI